MKDMRTTVHTTESVASVSGSAEHSGALNDSERVYFFSCAEAKAIKIGHSDDPEARLRACQTGCPLPLTLLGSIPGGVRKERELHGLFSGLRIHGEWFRSEPELLEFIGNALALSTGAPRVPSDPREREFEHDGERLTLSAWCRRLGLREMAVLGRLVDGLSLAEAINDPWVQANRVATH